MSIKFQLKQSKHGFNRTNKKINVFKNKKTNSLGRPKEFEINYKERYEILKKFLTFIKAQRKEKIIFINLYLSLYSLKSMCEVLEISTRTYYKYRNVEDKDYYDYLIIKRYYEL